MNKINLIGAFIWIPSLTSLTADAVRFSLFPEIDRVIKKKPYKCTMSGQISKEKKTVAPK